MKRIFKFKGPVNKPTEGVKIPILFGVSVVDEFKHKRTVRRRKGGGYIERWTMRRRKTK